MDYELKQVYELVKDAVRAEDVFGDLSSLGNGKSQTELLTEALEKFSATVNPDLYKASPNDYEIAMEMSDLLSKFEKQAREKIARGFYATHGQASSRSRGKKILVTDKRQYNLGRALVEGDLSLLYEGECFIDGDFLGLVAIKVIQDPQYNHLGQNEIKALKLLQEGKGKQLKHLPIFLDHFITTEGQLGIITNLIEDADDFYTIRERNPRGIPGKHASWILERSLSAISYPHNLGMLHGNLNPSHFMVNVATHNVTLVDWSYAIIDPNTTGDCFKGATDFFSPPEAFFEDQTEKRNKCLPASDLYSIGMSIIYLLGGDVETRILPDEVNDEFANFLNYLTLESAWQRAQNAEEEYFRLQDLRKKLGWTGFEPFFL
jgi:serine/threonine protein kinase